MKFCEICGDEICTKDGENRCVNCEDKSGVRGRKRQLKNEREQVMRDMGLVKVRGAMGGTYWE